MAHGLNGAKKPKLHQALHGYADGHRQLALSVTLKPRDQKMLLAMSDISGPGARLDEEGYLTGYPMPDSGFFALARTWPAPEMPRPGCVWTHTLLIDFADLAALESLMSLSDLFRRPFRSGDFRDYERSSHFDAEPPSGLPASAEIWTRQVMMALYGKPTSRIVVASSGSGADGAVLALWSQQWPRLRRSFRFCTFAASDRSIEGASFDLQLLPKLDRSLRSRFSYVIDAESIGSSTELWLEDALHDLIQPDRDGLRSFFRTLGSEAAAGRQAFRPLCRLHRAVRASVKRPEAVRDALSILQGELEAKQVRSARAVVAKTALNNVDALDEASFDFLLSNFSLIEPEAIASSAARLGRAAWQRDPMRLQELSKSEGVSKIVVDRTLAALDLMELIEGLHAAPDMIREALVHRPELVSQPAFWRDFGAGDEPYQTASREGLQKAAVSAMVEAGRSDLASRAVGELGTYAALQAMQGVQNVTGDNIRAWVDAAASDKKAVGNFLANESGIPRAMLLALARALSPDSVPNDYGPDPWLIAYQGSIGEIEETASFYLAAYLLSRALGARSRSSGELAQMSFETTHIATATDRLPEEGWRMLEPRLPWSAFWLDWDRCQRIRSAIIEIFVGRNLSPALFADLAHDDQLFLMLAHEATKSARGRNYLRRVWRAMKLDGNAATYSRVHAVEKLLN